MQSPAARESAPYRRIMAAIRGLIAAGSLKPGERVSSEHELMEAFGVSRMTAHRALRELAQEGLVVRAAGRGSYVAQRRLDVSLLRVPDIAEDIRAEGGVHDAVAVAIRRTRATADIAAALQIAPGEMVLHSLLVHRSGGAPVQIEDRYVNAAFAPDYLAQDFTSRTPNAYLTAIAPIEEAEQIVEAVAADARLARLLAIGRGSPCLKVTRRTWAAGMAATFVRLVSPGERWRFTARFRP